MRLQLPPLAIETGEAQQHRDPSEILTRLRESSAGIARLFSTCLFTAAAWLIAKVVIALNPAWRGDLPVHLGIGALTLVVWGALFWTRWRLDREAWGETQTRALKEIREQVETDPLAFEAGLPQLKRLSSRLSFVERDNHLIAREIVSRIESARAEARDLPIAHQTPMVADDLPRPV